MKDIIFVLNNFLVGGTERFLLQLINNLDKGVFNVKVVTIFGAGPLMEEFQRSGANVVILGPSSYPTSLKKPLWLFLSFFKLAGFMLKNKPDIVVTSLWQSDILGIFWAKLCGIEKRIFIQHDVYELSPIIRFLKKNLAVRFSTNIVAISDSVKEFLISYFNAPEKKIVKINNGIDFNAFQQCFNNNQEMVFGSVARIEPIKGHEYILEAAKTLKEQGLTPQILIYGEGSISDGIIKKAKDLGLDNIQFLGEELDQIKTFKSIDVLLAPSLSEGFGLTVLEALAAGKIVISSDLLAIKEFINDNNGILIPQKDSKALAFAMKRIMDDREYAEKLRGGVNEWLQGEGKSFDIKNISKEYSKLFLD